MRETASARSASGSRRGIALITALAFLTIFLMFGMAYVSSAVIELDRSDLMNQAVRARAGAAGGVQAAVALLTQAQPGDAARRLLAGETVELSIPVYDGVNDEGLMADPSRTVAVRVRATDESAKLNINEAPTSVLRSALGIDGATARAIRQSLPRFGEAAGGGEGSRYWFASVDDLVARGFLTEEQLSSDLAAQLTVWTTPEPARPGAYLNVNGVSAPILASILDMPLAEAEQVAAQRPFAGLDALSAAAGKTPDAFALASVPGGLDALAFAPVAFRVECVAQVMKDGRSVSRATAEAVVCLDGPRFTYWSEDDTVEDEPGTEPVADAS